MTVPSDALWDAFGPGSRLREFPTDQIRYVYVPPRAELPGPPPTSGGPPPPGCNTVIGYVPNALSLLGSKWYGVAIVEIGDGSVTLTAGGVSISVPISLQVHDVIDFTVSISVPVSGPEMDGVQYGSYFANGSAADVNPTAEIPAGLATAPIRIMPGSIATATIRVEVPFGGNLVMFSSRGTAGGASASPPYYADATIQVEHCAAGVTPSLTLDPRLPDDIREWAIAAFEKHDWSPRVPYTRPKRIGQWLISPSEL